MKINKRSLFSGNIFSIITNNMKIFIHFHMKSYILFKNQTKVVSDFEKCNYIQPSFIILHTNHKKKIIKMIIKMINSYKKI